jgi:hypothetical protein|tara:strand:- start:13 stop:180 length:168 start_codon:yes stop_codon:yes gene_type:complete
MSEEQELHWNLTLGQLIEIIMTVRKNEQFPCPMHMFDAKTVIDAVEQEIAEGLGI